MIRDVLKHLFLSNTATGFLFRFGLGFLVGTVLFGSCHSHGRELPREDPTEVLP